MPILRISGAALAAALLAATAASSAAIAADPQSAPKVIQKSVVTVGEPSHTPPSGNPELDGLVKQADDLRKKGDFEGALAKAKEALKKDPKYPSALLLAGTMEGATGRTDDALVHLKQAVTLVPDSVFARKVYATVLIQVHKLADAADVLAPALKVNPPDPQAYTMAAQIAASNSDFDQAEKYLDKALTADPAYQPGHQLGVRIAMVRRQPDAARKHLQAIVKAAPDDADAWVAIASLDAGQGHMADAQASLEKARKAQPKQPGPLIASAEMALRMRKLDEAQAYQAKLEALAPGSVPALSLKGEVLLAQGKPKEAVDPLRLALSKDALPEVLMQLYQALSASGQQAEADQRLADWLKAHPDDERMRFFAAESAARRGAFADAVVHFRKILEKDPGNLLALNDLAQSLQAQHDPQAVDIAEKAWKIQPDSPVTENTLGGILMSNGKSDRGLDLLRQAASKAQDNPEVRFDYARALAVTGDKAHAKTEIEAVLALKRPFREEAQARDMLKTLSGG